MHSCRPHAQHSRYLFLSFSIDFHLIRIGFRRIVGSDLILHGSVNEVGAMAQRHSNKESVRTESLELRKQC